MRQFDCPQCGAPVVFQSSTAESSVCAHCTSVVVQRGANIEAIGQMAVLPRDMSPLQIGVHGEIDGLAFTLLGRVRVKWEDGSWNEWFVEYGDQTRGWVGESQGFLMVLRESKLKEQIDLQPGDLKAGRGLEFNGRIYRIIDVKNVTCAGGEGELPAPVVSGEQWQSIDMEGGDGFVATLERSEEGWRLFEGKNASFEQINWQNLRQMPGWNGVPLETEHHSTDALNCPACGGVVELRAAGLTMTAVCSHCGSLLDTSAPQLHVVQNAAAARVQKPEIPLGQRGVIDGIEWEHIGFQCRRDPWSGWTEYLLFNPFHGFRWLTEFQGHWTLVDRLLTTQPDGDALNFEGRKYRIFARETCEVIYVEGEFYWQVRRGETAHVSDYISPPFILSREFYPELNEVSWSGGQYMPVEKLRTGFNLPNIKDPAPGSIGIVQPNPRREQWRRLKVLAFIFLAALVVDAMWSSNTRKTTLSYEKEFVFDRTTAAAGPMVTEPFQINSQGGVEVKITAPVDNSWIGFDMELVNQQTGQRFDESVTTEYYHGVDSDGSWSEGSNTGSGTIPGVPRGTYTLVMSGEADPSINQMPFRVSVSCGRTYSSNFIIALLLMLTWPVFAWIRSISFEMKRWSNSDFSPYKSSSSDDD